MSKKAEKRLAAAQLKLEKTLVKSAKQFADPEPHKQPRIETEPASAKKVAEAPLTPHQTYMTWNRKIEDRNGSWSWGTTREYSENEWTDRLKPFLESYEKKRWGEIDAETTGTRAKRRRKHCYYEFDQIKTEAYNRLVELKIDDLSDNIFRFRISGARRLYGFRIGTTFQLIWFDPDHKLWGK